MKRPREGSSLGEVDSLEFPAGTIKRIELKNFMTYAENGTVISPGPRLNLILGPNGSGKSSVVCALCVGLAGSTKLIGRAGDVCEYVKRGEREGWTSVTISGGPGESDFVVQRHITLGEKSTQSAWKVNGQPSSEKAVKALTARLNIQLSNLCQFLPQEKVGEFAGLAPEGLLSETERAIGDASLLRQHEELITLSKEIQAVTVDHAAGQKRLTQHRQDLDTMRNDVQRCMERTRLLDEATAIGSRIPWAVVRKRQLKTSAAREHFQAARQRAQKVAARVAEEGAPEVAAENRLTQSLAQSKSHRFDAERLLQADTQRQTELEQTLEAMSKNEEKRMILAVETSTHAVNVRDAEHSLAAVRESIANHGPEPQADPAALERLTRDIDTTSAEQMRAQADVDGMSADLAHTRQRLIGAEASLKRLDDVKLQRLGRMEHANSRFKGIYNYHQWLQSEIQGRAGLFKGRVWGPIGVELSLTQSCYAKQLESAVAAKLGMYVVECREDQETLIRESKRRAAGNRSMYIPPVSCWPGSTAQPLQPSAGPAEQYRQRGVLAALVDVVQAEPIVLHTLAAETTLLKVYLVDEHADAGAILRETGITRLMTPTRTISTFGSRYDSSKYLDDKGLSDPRVMQGGTTSGGERDRMQQEVEALRAAAQQQQAALAAQQQRVEAVAQRIASLSEERSRLDAASVEWARKGARDRKLEEARAKALTKLRSRRLCERLPPLLAEMEDLGSVMATKVAALAESVTASWPSLPQWLQSQLAADEAALQHRKLVAAARDRGAELEEAQRAETAAQTKLTQAEAKEKAAQATAAANGPDICGDLLDAGADVEALRTAQRLRQEAADATVVNDPGVMERWDRLNDAVRQEEGEAATRGDKLTELTTNSEAVKASWLPDLRATVASINESFTSNFSEVAAAGSVELHEDPTDDFSKFAINVLVKFREGEELHRLEKGRQSGGERSVTTLLYLIAIQAVTRCPFRVVDEINQGMDASNERKVFNQLVASCNVHDRSQCFMLTPKLLSDLIYYPNVKVLSIYNGANVAEVARGFDRTKLFGSMRLRQLTALFGAREHDAIDE